MLNVSYDPTREYTRNSKRHRVTENQDGETSPSTNPMAAGKQAAP